MIEDVQAMQAMVDTMVGTEKFSYPARQNNAPKPADEFAHIRLLEEYQIGIPARMITAQDEDTTTYRTISPARLRYRIGVVDTDGVASSRIMHGWTSESMKALMIATGYGFVRCTPLSNEDTKLEKEWEYRQGFSCEMYVTRVYDEVVDNIKSMTIEGAYSFDGLDLWLTTININN